MNNYTRIAVPIGYRVIGLPPYSAHSPSSVPIGYRPNHLSDMLRLAVVSKVGGLYTDFDFICLRSVADIRNSIALAVSCCCSHST